MNIQDIKNLKFNCHICKKEFIFSYINDEIFKSKCKDNNCMNPVYIIGYINNIFEIKTVTLYIDYIEINEDIAYGFYCDDYNHYRNRNFENWIKMPNENFYELLINYSKDSDIKKLQQKYETLKLFE